MLPHAEPAWVADYVGIGFAEGGRTQDGLDCWGLVRMVYADRAGIELPLLGGMDISSAVECQAAASRLLGSGRWRQFSEPDQVGDVGLFRLGTDRLHVGIAVSRGRMLHAQAGTQSCVERWRRPVWAPRVLGWFRLAELDGVRVSTSEHPMADAGDAQTAPAGLTVSEIVQGYASAAGPDLAVLLNGRELPRELWARVRPKPGSTVQVVAHVPAGESSGGGQKTPMRVAMIVATIAVVVAAPHIGGALGMGTFGSAAFTAGASIGMALLTNAIAPPPRPSLSDFGNSGLSPSINGARNDARPYQPIPVILGRHRVVPPYGAAPYTEAVGDEQYLRMLFVVGRGPLELTDMKIGETDLDDFEGVEVETRSGYPGEDPIRLFPSVVDQNNFSVELIEAESWTTRTSAEDATELGIDITLPTGLTKIEADGSRSARTVAVEIEYAPTGTSSWVAINEDAPSEARELDMLFREPEANFGGLGFHSGRVAWGSGFPDSKPGYLPASDYSWRAFGFVYAPADGDYDFGIDGSDACDLAINGKIIATFYGEHGPDGSPDFTGHQGTLTLTTGWHRIEVRVESRSGTGNIAVGWKKPGDGSFSIIPGTSLNVRADGSSGPGLSYRWYDTSGFTSSLGVTESTSAVIRRSLTWAVPEGQYDVRVRRTTPDQADESIFDRVDWTALRTITNQSPINEDGLALVALRIRASDQLNGFIDQFNLMAESVFPDWDSTAEAWVARATRNPASLYRGVLQGGGNARPVPNSRLDLDELVAWHESNTDQGFVCDAIFDFPGTVFERLNDVASAGRGSFGMRDGLYSVVRDRVQTTPVQHFTPANSRGFLGSRVFPDRPHALRVQFLNADKGYQRDERVVYDDGYDESNATKFETLELFGVTDGDLAWRHGRYHIATARLRPEQWRLTVDVEHLICQRGDLVLVTHDVPLIGLGYGRIAELLVNGSGNLTGVQLTNAVPMETGTQYQLRVRLADGTSWTRAIDPIDGETHELTFVTPVAPGTWPALDDLAQFGEVDLETREMVVQAIEMDEDLAATLILVDHAPAVHDADTGEIPDWDSGITLPPLIDRGPELPIIDYIRSDDLVMERGADGSLEPRIEITFRPQSGLNPIATLVDVRTRPKPAGGGSPVGAFRPHGQLPLEGNQVRIGGVEQGITYQIRLRYVTPIGQTSDWVTIEHTVVGKVSPPPNLTAFDVVRRGDGTRRYSWDFPAVIPPDLAGVKIRFGPGGLSSTWEELTPLHAGVLQGSPQDLNEPLEGLWTFGAKAVDTSGNECPEAILIDRELGRRRYDGVAFSFDAKVDRWP